MQKPPQRGHADVIIFLGVERRLGEIMAEARAAGKLAKNAPGPGRGKKGVKAGSPKDPALLSHGIDTARFLLDHRRLVLYFFPEEAG